MVANMSHVNKCSPGKLFAGAKWTLSAVDLDRVNLFFILTNRYSQPF